MSFYYVAEQEAVLRKQGEHLAIEVGGKVVDQPLLARIETLVILGRPRITQEAQLALLDNGTSVAYLSRSGHLKGRLVPVSHKNSILRQRQHALFGDDSQKISLVKAVVARKLRNGISVLDAYKRNGHSAFNFPQKLALYGIVEKVEQYADSSIDTLRGYEGAGSRLYFEGFAQCLGSAMGFEGRKYRPSTDPVNSMLSMGYSLLARELEAVLESSGLDPYIGFYHTVEYGRASLSLDLMEEFRHPLVDRMVLGIVNKKQATSEDFEFREDENEGQLYMKTPTLRMFLGAYEEYCQKEFDYGGRRVTWRKLMRSRAEELRKALLTDQVWQPFSWDDSTCDG